MNCTNPACQDPKKEHLFLFAGKLCAKCQHLYVPIVERKEKASFDIFTNDHRKQARHQKKVRCRRSLLNSEKNIRRGKYVVCIGRFYFQHLHKGDDKFPSTLNGAYIFRLEKTAQRWADKFNGTVKDIRI